MKKLKIAWQKYEDLLEQQMSSPLFDILANKISNNIDNVEEEEEEYEEEHTYQQNILLPISEKLIEDMAMLSNFDCWMAYTNFDITEDIKNILNTIEGIEIMRICSRYRFFIGIGKMFKFQDVRSEIEKTLL